MNQEPSNNIETGGEGDTAMEARIGPEREQAAIPQQEYAESRAVLHPTSDSVALDEELDLAVQAVHQEFDTVIRTAYADALIQAAEIKSRAQADAEALLKQARDEKTQLEAKVASLRQAHDCLAQTLRQTLLSLEQGLQTMTSSLGQAEEQVKRQMQVLREANVQVESTEVTVADEPLRVEEAAIGTYTATAREVVEEYRPGEGEGVQQYQVPTGKASEAYRATAADQPVSETQVRIIGLRQISRLRCIEGALRDAPAVEDVRITKYSEGVLIMAIICRPTSLINILKEIPGLSAQYVRDVGQWIEVRLGDTT